MGWGGVERDWKKPVPVVRSVLRYPQAYPYIAPRELIFQPTRASAASIHMKGLEPGGGVDNKSLLLVFHSVLLGRVLHSNDFTCMLQNDVSTYTTLLFSVLFYLVPRLDVPWDISWDTSNGDIFSTPWDIFFYLMGNPSKCR